MTVQAMEENYMKKIQDLEGKIHSLKDELGGTNHLMHCISAFVGKLVFSTSSYVQRKRELPTRICVITRTK